MAVTPSAIFIRNILFIIIIIKLTFLPNFATRHFKQRTSAQTHAHHAVTRQHGLPPVPVSSPERDDG
jgi:hypothetical protein